ncbi:Ribonuclease [Platysternon megacephalum]|uniref:Ribonuclease n=1 Tax=Platysternon megacephalum TaxID=55544 RepID=A0A4D9DED1_9SAUR|nr:Ribonuclease [Platysternon megacephalum]
MEEADPHPTVSPAISPLSPLQVDPVTDTAMAPRGPCPWLFLTPVLLAAGLAHFRPRDTYERFMREHVNFPKTSATNDHCYGNLLLRRQNLTGPFCKPPTLIQPHVPRQSPEQPEPRDLRPGKARALRQSPVEPRRWP